MQDAVRGRAEGQLAERLRAERSTGHTVIGRSQYGGQQVDFLRGAVDDVWIFDRVLSDSEVAAPAVRE